MRARAHAIANLALVLSGLAFSPVGTTLACDWLCIERPDAVEQARREWLRRWQDIRARPDHVQQEREAYERRWRAIRAQPSPVEIEAEAYRRRQQ